MSLGRITSLSGNIVKIFTLRRSGRERGKFQQLVDAAKVWALIGTPPGPAATPGKVRNNACNAVPGRQRKRKVSAGCEVLFRPKAMPGISQIAMRGFRGQEGKYTKSGADIKDGNGRVSSHTKVGGIR